MKMGQMIVGARFDFVCQCFVEVVLCVWTCANGLACSGVAIALFALLCRFRPAVPSQFSKTLEALLDRGQESPLEDVRTVFQEEIGQNLNDAFCEFEEKPIGCASLAQVHKAVLKSGESVAVKVQHYRLRNDAPADLWALRQAIRLLEFSFEDVVCRVG